MKFAISKTDIRPAICLAALLVGVVVGYSATTRSSKAEQLDAARGKELSAAHRRITALETLISRYREELSYVDHELERNTTH